MVSKRDLSNFIILNLVVLAFVNLPPGVRNAKERVVSDLPPVAGAVVSLVGGLGRMYAAISGQSNTWRLFVTIPRTARRTVVKAEYADGILVTLPLPLQSERTFWQRRFFDLKETRLLASQVVAAPVREAYADFLCRRYPEHAGAPVRAIVWHGELQEVLPPREAELAGTHLAEPVDTGIIERVPCRPAGAK